MNLVGDERAQSIQIGAVLLFGVLIIAFSSYQAFVVPDQNQQIEFNHNQEAHSQMQDLRNAIVSVRGTGTGRSVSVKLGTRYPSRVIARNPGPPSGSLRTVGTTDPTRDLTIANAQANGETGDFWNQDRSYNTGGIVYSPNYNVYTSPPETVYENTVLYNRFRSGTITLANQSFIDGTDISLVVVNGTVSESSGQSTSVDVESVSSSTERVRLEDDGSPIVIEFTSQRSAAYWNFLTTQGTVTDVRSTDVGGGFHDVEVELDQSETYSVQLTKVGVGTGVTDENAAYMTDIDGDGSSVSQGETTELTLEVRDRLNNPPADLASITVEGEVADSGTLKSTSATPDEDGQVTFVYEAPTGTTGTQDIEFSYIGIDGSFDASTPQNVSMTVDVTSGGGGGGGGGGGNAYSVNWLEPSGQIDCSGDVCTLDGSNRREVDLTMTTSPTAQQARVDYAVNDTTVGVPVPNEGRTDSNGENTTTLEAQNEGTVDVYTYSGGSGDVIPIRVENLQFATVAFIDENDNDDLKTIQSDGTVRTHVPKSTDQVRGISPVEDIDGDGTDEIAYVTNSRELKYVDTSTDVRTTVLGSGSVEYSSSTIGVGDGVGGPAKELYYLNDSDNDYLYRAFLDGTTERVIYGNQGCNPTGVGNENPVSEIYGVLDVTDFDADGNPDIVYVESNNDKIAYIETENCERNIVSGNRDYTVAVNNAPAGGEVISYNGEYVVPIVDGNNDIAVVSANGTADALPSSYEDAAGAPVAPRDWDGDGQLEIVHLNNNQNNNLYYAGVQDSELVEILNEDDQPERARDEGGAR